MRIAYMTYGRPSSGKSHWCISHASFCQENYINLDTIRQNHPGLKAHRCWTKAVDYLDTIKGRPAIFIDNTHVTQKQWDMFYTPLKTSGYKIILVYFDIPVDVCLARNTERERHVPEDVIEKWQHLPLDKLNYPRDETIIVRYSK